VWLIVMNGKQRNAMNAQIWGKWNDLNYDGNCTTHHFQFDRVYILQFWGPSVWVLICWRGGRNWYLVRLNAVYIIRLVSRLYILLNYSMEQSPFWEANWFSTSEEIPRVLLNPKVHYHIPKCPQPVPILSQLRSSPCPHIPLPEDPS